MYEWALAVRESSYYHPAMAVIPLNPGRLVPKVNYVPSLALLPSPPPRSFFSLFLHFSVAFCSFFSDHHHRPVDERVEPSTSHVSRSPLVDKFLSRTIKEISFHYITPNRWSSGVIPPPPFPGLLSVQKYVLIHVYFRGLSK